jgi:hypothetical protein
LYSCSFVEVGKVGQHIDYGVKCMPDHVWPLIKENDAEFGRIPGHIRRLAGASLQMPSSISCIKLSRKLYSTMDDSSNIQEALYPLKKTKIRRRKKSNFGKPLLSYGFLFCYLYRAFTSYLFN